MSKWHRVTVTQVITFAVEVADDESEEQALDIALMECSMDGDRTGETEEVSGEIEIDRLKRHADQVISLDD